MSIYHLWQLIHYFFFCEDDKIISRPGGPSPQGARGPNCSAGNVIMEQSISQQQSSVGGGFPPSSPGMVSTAPNSGSTGNINFSSPIQMNAVPLGHTSEECDVSDTFYWLLSS